jgi:hypothetical protein
MGKVTFCKRHNRPHSFCHICVWEQYEGVIYEIELAQKETRIRELEELLQEVNIIFGSSNKCLVCHGDYAKGKGEKDGVYLHQEEDCTAMLIEQALSDKSNQSDKGEEDGQS